MLIVILTSNRSHLLRRCLAAIMPHTDGGDSVLVLDESTSREKGLSLEEVKSVSANTIAYLHASKAFALLEKQCSADSLEWTRRTCIRDIAPLRNLSLALFAADDAHSVCALVDDDVIPDGFDHMARMVQNIEDHSYVAGPNIGGVDEMDTITRLQRICPRLRSARATARIAHPKNVLLESAQVSLSDPGTVIKVCDHVSAGCMFFNRAAGVALPFPPGYNEDWHWCLMRQHYGTRVYRLPHVVEHAPDSLRPISEADLLFEVVGDVILGLLIARNPSFSGLAWPSLPEVQARIAPTLAAIRDAGLALYEELRALRQVSPSARATITADEVASLFNVCCNSYIPRTVQRVQEWLRVLPNHATSFQLFLDNHSNGPLRLIKERIYAD